MTTFSDSYRSRHFTVPIPKFEGDDAYKPRCGEDPDLFFSRDGGHGDREETAERVAREREAKSYCAACPFMVECALHGLEYEDYGVFGCLTEAERRGLGGRGLGFGVAPTKKAIVRRLELAGVPESKVVELFTRWAKRRRELRRRKAA